jgi:hypothetical protein
MEIGPVPNIRSLRGFPATAAELVFPVVVEVERSAAAGEDSQHSSRQTAAARQSDDGGRARTGSGPSRVGGLGEPEGEHYINYFV